MASAHANTRSTHCTVLPVYSSARKSDRPSAFLRVCLSISPATSCCSRVVSASSDGGGVCLPSRSLFSLFLGVWRVVACLWAWIAGLRSTCPAILTLVVLSRDDQRALAIKHDILGRDASGGSHHTPFFSSHWKIYIECRRYAFSYIIVDIAVVTHPPPHGGYFCIL